MWRCNSTQKHQSFKFTQRWRWWWKNILLHYCHDFHNLFFASYHDNCAPASRFFTLIVAHNFLRLRVNLSLLFDTACTTYFFSWAFFIPPIFFIGGLRNNTLYTSCISACVCQSPLPVPASNYYDEGGEINQGKRTNLNKDEKKLYDLVLLLTVSYK